MHDCLIIGGGVIGLSLAWDLAKHGRSVHVIDQSEPGREASWAGAGILPAAKWQAWQHPFDQLRGLAAELHPHWAAELQTITGIDTGYRHCGALHLARTAGEAAALTAWAAMMAQEGVEVQRVEADQLPEIEPGLLVSRAATQRQPVPGTQYPVLRSEPVEPSPYAVFLIPSEAQLRNPRHLRALADACAKAGVSITSNVTVNDLATFDGQLDALPTSAGSLSARQYCFTAGAWTGQLLQRLGIETGILPVRGQMILFHSQRPPVSHIINEGSRYLVPRDDGYVLAGSTEEEVGFDKRTTDDSIADLAEFARSLVPALRDTPIEQTWAGLRPGSFDGLPYLGPLPGLNNAFVAAGHFRSGLFLSPATAIVMSQLMRGEQPQVDLSSFRIGR